MPCKVLIKIESERTYYSTDFRCAVLIVCSYKTAEKVSERLTEMGKDLTSMIEEINAASAMISKTTKPDDPVSYSEFSLAVASS